VENITNIPIPLRIRATLRRRTEESTHISSYSWLSARYPRRGNTDVFQDAQETV